MFLMMMMMHGLRRWEGGIVGWQVTWEMMGMEVLDLEGLVGGGGGRRWNIGFGLVSGFVEWYGMGLDCG